MNKRTGCTDIAGKMLGLLCVLGGKIVNKYQYCEVD
jgi:hypothetical protein